MYLKDLKESINLPITSHMLSHYNKLDKINVTKSIKSQYTTSKRRRNELRQEREKLRVVNEKEEIITYKSNVAFKKRSNNEKSSLNEVIENTDLKEDYKMVVFDLETSGRKKNSDILQLTAIVQENVFSVYVTPTQDVDKFASEINGLHNIGRELYLRNEKLLTLSMVDALQAFYAFLCKVGQNKKCILIAHNASFDISFFLRECIKYSLIDCFKSIVYGFCDSLQLFRQKFPDRKGKGMCTLSKLAEDLLENHTKNENYHEAVFDVSILQ